MTAVEGTDEIENLAAFVARHGLAVFDLPPRRRRPTPGWQGRYLETAQEVRAHWRRGDNVGVDCRASRLVGLDLDRKDGTDGVAAFDALCATYRESRPETLTIATAHDGQHSYFRARPGWRYAPARSLPPGISSRGPGGYLIGPGSVVDGVTYTVVNDAPIAELPRWLAARVGHWKLPRVT